MRERVRRGEDALRVVRVHAHLLPLGGGQRPRLLPDRVRHGESSKIVEVGGDLDVRRRPAVETQALRGAERERRHTGRVAVQAGELQVAHVAEDGGDTRKLVQSPFFDRLRLLLQQT
jgi:hypothetical protein